MANLYELNRQIAEFELVIDEETGEITNAEELDQIQMERDEKIENIALWIKNLKADAEAFKNEKQVFAEKERIAKNKAECLTAYIHDALHGEKFETTRVRISYRKSQAVEITDPDKLPAAMLRLKEPEPDKAKIKDLLKAGTIVAGAELVERQSIQIK